MNRIDWEEAWENIFGEVAKLIVFIDGSASIIDPEGYEHPYPTCDRATSKLMHLGYR